MKIPEPKKTFHVISGTHWDREWRFTAEQSLLRLAELVDELLDVMERTDYKCFLLDGGTVVIEDYLNVRPENEERLRALMQAGRIQTVMWYTLPEMSTVAPESLIRNLLIGKRMADRFGGAVNAGYTATSYGQISQLAQIYAGFGMKSALSYRGTNKEQIPPICRLESPDGTQIFHLRCFDEVTRTNWFFFPHYKLVLGKHPRDLSTKWNPSDGPVHMADAGLYESAFQLKSENMDFNTDPQAIREAIRMLGAQAEPQRINNQLLALDMEDNAVPYNKLPELIAACNEAQSEYKIQQAGIDDYVDACLDGIDPETVPVHKGEMRYTLVEAGFNGLLGATHSSRMDLKLENDLAQRELIDVAEPLSAMSALLGGSYEKILLDRAWLYLLKNHAHDSICGAAISQAHQDNPFRFRAATAIAQECSRKACEEIWQQIDTAGTFADGDLTLTFFNTQPVARHRIESVVVDTPRPDFGNFKLETCTGVGPIVEGFEPDKMLTFQYFDLIDEEGNKVPYTVLEREDIDMEVERKLDSNAAVFDILRNRLLIDIELPPMGWRTLAVRPRLREYEPNPQPAGERSLIAAQNGTLENEFVQVQINPNGTLDYTNKETGKQLSGLHVFTDDASTGNAHKHSGVLRNTTVSSLCEQAHLTLVENNALRATWRIDLQPSVPECAALNAKDRSRTLVRIPVSTCVTLAKGSRRLEFKTVIENRAQDHRLRLLFPTGVQTDFACADSPFDVVRRNILWNNTKDNMEPHHPFQPMQRFVTISDGKEGVSFMSKGIGEYEVFDDAARTLAVTLLRTTRVSMKANRGQMTPDELERSNGHQLPGKFEYHYAITAHAGSWDAAGIHWMADDFRTPVRVLQGVPRVGKLPVKQSMLEIEKNREIQVSALCRTEDGATVLRLWNSASEPVETKLTLNAEFQCLEQIDLAETLVHEKVPMVGNSAVLKFQPLEIQTLRFK
jgi:alpha-mannosidase